MLDEVEYYILVTRFFAASMTLVILYEIYTDRQAFSQKLPFITGIICMTLAGLAYLYREDVLVLGQVNLDHTRLWRNAGYVTGGDTTNTQDS